MYLLKVQSRYDVSHREWHGKGRNDVQPEGAEVGMTGQVMNGIWREMTYLLKVQSRYDGSDRK